MARRDRPKEDRRDRFVQEYCKDLNATQACIRAGYAQKGAHVQGSRLLSDPKVRGAIDQLLAKAAAANQVTIERTLKEIARIAYADVRKLYDEKGNLKPIRELDDDAAACIAAVETEELFAGSGEERISIGVSRKVKRFDKGKALDQCMAFLGMHKSLNPAESGGMALTINLSGGKKVK
jgi:phage terminase small subunit